MNHEERRALQDFLLEMSSVRLRHKDHEAERMIEDAVSRQPDAAYLLVQRALLQEQALNTAQQQIAALRQQLESARHIRPTQSSQRLLDPASQWGRSARLPDDYPAARASYPAQGPGYGYHDRPYNRPGLLGGGMGSFLGSMAGLAAGAAAGSFLYHGIEDLLHPETGEAGAGEQGGADMLGAGASPEPAYDGGELSQDAGIDDIGSWSDEGNMGGGEDYA